MVGDEYDSRHFSDYDYTINFYKDSNIAYKIKDFYRNNDCDTDYTYAPYSMSQFEENEKLSSQITKTIFTLRDALNVLENRYITNIGSRVFHYIITEPDTQPVLKCYLIQVWRS